MRLSWFTVTAVAAVLISQSACARPSDRPAPARLAARDDARPVTALASASPADAVACTRDAASLLDAAIARTLGAVRGNDGEALLDQIGSDGLDINGQVSRDSLSSQFSHHTGRYCDLFSCNGREGDMHRLFHSGPTDKQVDAIRGRASVFINANTNDELDLSYRFGEDCRWQLTAIAAP